MFLRFLNNFISAQYLIHVSHCPVRPFSSLRAFAHNPGKLGLYWCITQEEKREREREKYIEMGERKKRGKWVSVILIALVPSSISIVVVKVIYFLLVKFRYEKKSFFAVYISWPAYSSFDFSSLFYIFKKGKAPKNIVKPNQAFAAWKTKWMSPSSLLQHFQNSRFQMHCTRQAS